MKIENRFMVQNLAKSKDNFVKEINEEEGSLLEEAVIYFLDCFCGILVEAESINSRNRLEDYHLIEEVLRKKVDFEEKEEVENKEKLKDIDEYFENFKNDEKFSYLKIQKEEINEPNKGEEMKPSGFNFSLFGSFHDPTNPKKEVDGEIKNKKKEPETKNQENLKSDLFIVKEIEIGKNRDEFIQIGEMNLPKNSKNNNLKIESRLNEDQRNFSFTDKKQPEFKIGNVSKEVEFNPLRFKFLKFGEKQNFDNQEFNIQPLQLKVKNKQAQENEQIQVKINDDLLYILNNNDLELIQTKIEKGNKKSKNAKIEENKTDNFLAKTNQEKKLENNKKGAKDDFYGQNNLIVKTVFKVDHLSEFMGEKTMKEQNSGNSDALKPFDKFGKDLTQKETFNVEINTNVKIDENKNSQLNSNQLMNNSMMIINLAELKELDSKLYEQVKKLYGINQQNTDDPIQQFIKITPKKASLASLENLININGPENNYKNGANLAGLNVSDIFAQNKLMYNKIAQIYNMPSNSLINSLKENQKELASPEIHKVQILDNIKMEKVDNLNQITENLGIEIKTPTFDRQAYNDFLQPDKSRFTGFEESEKADNVFSKALKMTMPKNSQIFKLQNELFLQENKANTLPVFSKKVVVSPLLNEKLVGNLSNEKPPVSYSAMTQKSKSKSFIGKDAKKARTPSDTNQTLSPTIKYSAMAQVRKK